MALETYHSKRNFGSTPEPRGASTRRRKKAAELSFVIQKHAARRLHYDLRLEMDGVLKSWAVTKGPSLVPGEKRLAVHVEDHPLEYGSFEGTIPKGEYGGGTVIVWDRGTWEPVGDLKKGYAKGHIDFRLKGEKLSGEWHLVRMGQKKGEKENWLLIKATDEFAREEGEPDILEERPESVKTGRVVEEVADEKPGWSSKKGKLKTEETALPVPAKAKKAKWPGFIEPALATLAKTAPSGAKWLHEIKFDGYRIQAHIQKGKVKLYTRSGLDWTERFGKDLANALKKLPVDEAILDGEVIVEADGAVASFSSLQADLSEGRTDRMVYYAFDLLHLDGMDLRGAPLTERKRTLQVLLHSADPVLRFSEHFEEDGQTVLNHACKLSLEGIISKTADAAYGSGRSRNWLKAKCSKRQEFVVIGYTPSTTSSTAIGSLALGYYDKGDLIYAGRVGTGFTQKTAKELFGKLSKLKAAKTPTKKKLTTLEAKNLQFVKPELVAEVEFQVWTADNIIRHAAFQGLREDKSPQEIVRESEGGPVQEPVELPDVRLTHPDRVYWEDVGVTKQGLAEYYVQVWPRMESVVVNRPLALVRCPDGAAGQCFFQKHAWKGQSKDIILAKDPEDDEPVIAIKDLKGLIGLVQGGTLEIHPWGANLKNLEKPDSINMDLDPGPGVEWPEVIEAAIEVRERLAAFGLKSFVKTSGGKGLHVVAPLKPKALWEDVKAFAKGIADSMAEDDSSRYVATVSKAKRKGKILIDYLRNGRGATAVAPYSTRSRDGAPVSMPLAWDELSPDIGPAYFTVENAVQRLAVDDPWKDFWKAAVALPKAKKK